jgi:hypothetical protein
VFKLCTKAARAREERRVEKKQMEQVNLKTKCWKRTIIYQKRRAIRQTHKTTLPTPFHYKDGSATNKSATARNQNGWLRF